MKIDIIICYKKRYKRGHEIDFVPPLTGIFLASLIPDYHEVRVIHQQIEKINFKTDSTVIALSFFSGFAEEAFRLSKIFKSFGKIVIAGGPHVSFNQEESLKYFDSIIVGEADNLWTQLLQDIEVGNLKKVYQGYPSDLKDLPAPRYDLLSNRYIIKRVIQATRGCYYKCKFCSVPSINPGYRMRPVDDVIREVSFNRFQFWWQRKIVWFWDDNLLINKSYAYELLGRMKKLDKWWLTQSSIEIAKDEKLLNLMYESGCIGIFLGIETFDRINLLDQNKFHNKVNEYKEAIRKIHNKGIAVMAGIIVGFENDSVESINEIPSYLKQMGIDVPFISILTPFNGTEIFDEYQDQNLILKSESWSNFNGYNVAFIHNSLTEDQLLSAHRKLWKKCFMPFTILIRIFKSLFYLRSGAFFLSATMNLFYGFKFLSYNHPIKYSFDKN